jgi:hypothetical protein
VINNIVKNRVYNCKEFGYVVRNDLEDVKSGRIGFINYETTLDRFEIG